MNTFVKELRSVILTKKKMTSPLYQLIMSGQASQHLLRNFVIHRYPIKSFWTRNILGIASKLEDYDLRVSLVNNIYEEETGRLTSSQRHLASFTAFGKSVGVKEEELINTPWLEETRLVIDHNLEVCNGNEHFTCGTASVLLLMEGQPPIISKNGQSMLSVMRDIYQLPPEGYEFFEHHASSEKTDDHTSSLEDEHAKVAEEILIRYCTNQEMQSRVKWFLTRAIERRYLHFNAIYQKFYCSEDPPFRYQGTQERVA